MDTVKSQTAVPVQNGQASVRNIKVSCFTIPTDAPESDGTLQWKKTTMVYVEVGAEKVTGCGYTYADRSTAHFILEHLKPLVMGQNVFNNALTWEKMHQAIRNIGHPGVASMAIAAIDIALWDLKSKILKLPLATLLGAVHEKIAVYGSGGFTSYSENQLQQQFEKWIGLGIFLFKMKVGRAPEKDIQRVKHARKIIGDNHELFVDANGKYSVREASKQAKLFYDEGVNWFEEPVSSDNLKGLQFVRQHAPPGMNIAAGEYGYDVRYFHRMLKMASVDVLQADATRCGGITGFLKAGVLCDAYEVPLSAHTAPSVHLPVCCAVQRAVHIEYFHDHERIEQLFFDGFRRPENGFMSPDLSKPGLGLELKEDLARQYLVFSSADGNT